jgi:hypothetical protein
MVSRGRWCSEQFQETPDVCLVGADYGVSLVHKGKEQVLVPHPLLLIALVFSVFGRD